VETGGIKKRFRSLTRNADEKEEGERLSRIMGFLVKKRLSKKRTRELGAMLLNASDEQGISGK